MLPRNVQHLYVINPDKTKMYGYSLSGKLGWIHNLPWLRPYLFCSQTEAHEFARKNRAIALFWYGKVYENSPDINDMSR